MNKYARYLFSCINYARSSFLVVMSINRWILRRRRKLLVAGLFLFFLIIFYVYITHDDISTKASEYFWLKSERCPEGKKQQLLGELCGNFSLGILHGSLCEAICLHKIIRLDQCINHGSTYVLFGKYGDMNIVMKRKPSDDVRIMKEELQKLHDRRSFDGEESARRYYLSRLAKDLASEYGKEAEKALFDNLHRISLKLFNKNINQLSSPQLINSLDLIGQREIFMMLFHQSMDSFTKFYGSCGSFSVIERVTPLSYYSPEIIPKMKWDKRVAIAKSFLKLVREMEKSKLGSLQNCDIQSPNFGITADYRVKSIDMDLLYPESIVRNFLPRRRECYNDTDCDFFDCLSKCDLQKNECTDIQASSNLQIICRDIFTASSSWPMSGLLTRFQPASVSSKLKYLIEECESPSFGSLPFSDARVQAMLSSLEKLLDYSLEEIR